MNTRPRGLNTGKKNSVFKMTILKNETQNSYSFVLIMLPLEMSFSGHGIRSFRITWRSQEQIFLKGLNTGHSTLGAKKFTPPIDYRPAVQYCLVTRFVPDWTACKVRRGFSKWPRELRG